jgi:hypothetical protein
VDRLSRFHDGLADANCHVSDPGLLVFPSRLPAVVGSGLLITGVAVFLARPVSVFIALFPVNMSLQEKCSSRRSDCGVPFRLCWRPSRSWSDYRKPHCSSIRPSSWSSPQCCFRERPFLLWPDGWGSSPPELWFRKRRSGESRVRDEERGAIATWARTESTSGMSTHKGPPTCGSGAHLCARGQAFPCIIVMVCCSSWSIMSAGSSCINPRMRRT